MADHARSDNAAVQRQLDRLALLSPGRDTLGLERITALLERLGNPHEALPPCFHVAGTNGKGSTCAFLRAALEAAGLSVHAYTSPHLVRFNERIRVAGSLIGDAELAALLDEVLDYSEGLSASFFEVTTAAALLAFSRVPADACVVEVGLGGRLDATNVLTRPAVTGIAQLGIDHQSFLGNDPIVIAGEKAGIAKPGVPFVTLQYRDEIAARIEREARAHGAEWIARGRDWDGAAYRGQLHYRDSSSRLRLPLPRLVGEHQTDNALLAIAMLSHQQRLPVGESALKAAMGWAEWPARLQKLESGKLVERLPPGSQLWLDGGHNPLAAQAIAAYFEGTQDLHIVAGLLANKDPAGFLAPFASIAKSMTFVPIAHHACHAPDTLKAQADILGVQAHMAATIDAALESISADTQQPTIAILGSLYLAGEVLRANETYPD
jgi:dihydrofolate synthase/folylpolyglutamate synthase